MPVTSQDKKSIMFCHFFLLVVLKFKFRAVVHVSVISKKIEIKRHTLLSLINQFQMICTV